MVFIWKKSTVSSSYSWLTDPILVQTPLLQHLPALWGGDVSLHGEACDLENLVKTFEFQEKKTKVGIPEEWEVSAKSRAFL